jgi:hypothetical protein
VPSRNGFRNTNLQKYYLTDIKSKIIEDNKRNVQTDTLVISHIHNHNPVENGNMQVLQFMLEQIDSYFLHIHKLQITL